MAATTSWAVGGSIPSPWDSSTLQERQSNRLCRGTSEEAALTLPRRTLASERDFSQARLQRKASFLPSTFLQLRPRSPPSARDRSCPGAQGKSSLCVCVHLAGRYPFPCFCLKPLFRRLPAGCPRIETNPSATTSSLLPSVEMCARSKSRSRKKMFVEDPCSTLPTDLSNRILHCKSPAAQDPRLSNTLLCGGQKGQGCGHKSNGRQKEVKAGGDGAKGPPGKVPSPFSRRGELAVLSTARKRAGRTSACSVGFKLGHKIVSRWCSWTEVDATFCHPCWELCRVSLAWPLVVWSCPL